MPDNTVYVGRPTIFGNPYHPKDYMLSLRLENEILPIETPRLTNDKFHEFLVSAYRHFIESHPELMLLAKNRLRGKNLACFCPLDRPCHADVLLEIANS